MAKRPTPVKPSRTYGKPVPKSPNTRLEIAIHMMAAIVAKSPHERVRQPKGHIGDVAMARARGAFEYADALMRAEKETANAK